MLMSIRMVNLAADLNTQLAMDGKTRLSNDKRRHKAQNQTTSKEGKGAKKL
jgi:hypothetical protein